MSGPAEPPIAVLAEFDSPRRLLEAARAAYAAGYRRLDAYTPFPVHGMSEALGLRRNRVALIVLLGGLAGGLGGFLMQWYSAVVDYPLDVGGRPLNSWPAFIPITFELTILGAGLAAVAGLLTLAGLPKPYHPVFNVPEFARASKDRFFLAIDTLDPRFEEGPTRRMLNQQGALHIHDVAP